jgi:penicillin amidase
MKRWSIRIAAGLLMVAALVVLIAFDFVRSLARSVPSYDGTVVAGGLAEPVQILRDRYAVPHILARSYGDAAFALGYAHAQDRLWQMEMSRRFVQGRLAELLGETALGADLTMRALGLYSAAEDAVEHLSRDAQRTLSAYADGVNAYISGHKGRWPIEFVLAGDAPPELWRPADSVAVLKGMAFQLSTNAFTEAARAELIPVLGRKGVEDFFPPFSDAVLPDYLDEVYTTTRTGAAFGIPDTTASDNWVVDGAHSVTGKPLLANDPHLGFSIPSVWYLAHLSIPDEDMVGGTLAGVPSIIVGRNRHLAWGMTNTGPDTEDLYLERVDPDNSAQYLTPAGFAAFDTRVESIKVRFGRERRITLRATRHGPVVSDAQGSSFAAAAPRGYVLALAWTAFDPDDTTLDAVFILNHAQSAVEARAAARLFVTPMQNLVYADDAGKSGHIGLMLPGRVPLRSEKNDSLGLVPAPGWDGRYDWDGFIPAEKTVDIADPPSGHIATANNNTVPPGYEYTLTREWETNYRYNRIEDLLAGTAPHSLTSFKAIQSDIDDDYALQLTQRLVRAGPFEGTDAKAAELLAQWDGAMLASRPEPLIWAAWARALAGRIYADELGGNFRNFWGYRSEFTLRVLDDVEGEGRWCDDKATPEIEDCASRIRLALHDAVTELSRAYGNDPARWRWGDAHKAVHTAQPLGVFPYIGDIFNREVEMDGGPNTLLRGDTRMTSRRPYAAIHGAGYRGLYDLANPDASLYIISTGQSGNVFSPHYDDLLALWAKRQYIAIPTTPDAVAAATVYRLTLRPSNAAVAP